MQPTNKIGGAQNTKWKFWAATDIIVIHPGASARTIPRTASVMTVFLDLVGVAKRSAMSGINPAPIASDEYPANVQKSAQNDFRAQ